MKEICILSMQKVQNYGSLLQGYALKKLIEEVGGRVRFIDIERRESDDQLRCCSKLEFIQEKERCGKFTDKLRKIDRYFFNRLKIKLQNTRQNQLFDNFREKVLQIDESDNHAHYDTCVIGSDEVFNCMIPSQWGFTTQLFGDVRQSDKVITYAASCGATTLGDLNGGMRSAIQKALSGVSAFSARDNNTVDFIDGIVGSGTAQQHCDPVWVYDFTEEVERTLLTVDLPERYCIIYSYSNRIHSHYEIDAILEFCRRNLLTPIAIEGGQMWLKNFVVASPFEVLKIFQGAEFIITDTFHGTIMAEKFNGNYAVMLRDSNRNKLEDLIHRIHAENHLIVDFSELQSVYGMRSSRSASLARQSSERIRTMEYLKENL